MRQFLLAGTSITSAVITAFASPAGAADLAPVRKAVAPIHVASWEGVYIGGFAGGHWSRDRWTSDETGPGHMLPGGAPGGLPLDINGFSGGYISGANLQHGNYVWGVETDIGFLTGKETLGPLRAQFPATASTDFIETQLRYNAHARLRFGHSFGSWMPFVAVGAAYANTRNTQIDNNNIIRRDQTMTLDRIGTTFGAGVDWMIKPNWILRAEYLHDRYLTAGYGSRVDNDSEYFQLTSNTVRGAVLYKFGDAAATAGTYKAPPRARAAGGEWAGIYLGAFAGGHNSFDQWSSDETGPGAFQGPFNINVSGVNAGGLIGANFQHGQYVWGVELDAGAFGGRKALDNLFRFGGATVDTVETQGRWNAHARIRSGYSFGNWMPFLAAGAAYANTRVELSRPGFAVPRAGISLDRVGATAGGGIDWMFAPGWIARAEYMLDRFTGAGLHVPTNSNSEHMALHSHIGRLALMYKFGEPAMPAAPAGVYKAPVVAAAALWTGGYLGIYGGGHWSRDRWVSDETGPATTDPIYLKSSGGVAGGLIGANKQIGSAVFSLEADGGWVGGNGGRTGADAAIPVIVSIETATRANAHARARFGWSMGSWMPFIAAGAAYADTRVGIVARPGFGDNGSIGLTRAGMTIGGGVDWMVNPNWILRAEYLHDRFATATAPRLVSPAWDSQHLELKSSIVRGAVMYKF